MVTQNVIICVLAALIGIAAYTIITIILHIPSAKGSRVLKKTQSEKDKETFFMRFLRKSALKIKLSPYNKKRLANALEVSKITKSPEEYILESVFLGLFSSLIGSVLFIIYPLAGLVGLLLGPILGYVKYNETFKKFKKHKLLVEREVPRFTQSVAENLKITRDVVAILTAYKAISNKSFGFELEKTIADMKTSNYEAALLRFDTRIGSVHLSETIRGLIGCLRGNDERTHFENLATNMKNVERNLIQKEANKKPRKMHSLSMIMFFSIVILYIVVFGTVLTDSLAVGNF